MAKYESDTELKDDGVFEDNEESSADEEDKPANRFKRHSYVEASSSSEDEEEIAVGNELRYESGRPREAQTNSTNFNGSDVCQPRRFHANSSPLLEAQSIKHKTDQNASSAVAARSQRSPRSFCGEERE